MASDSDYCRLLILVLQICPDLCCGLNAVHYGHTEICKDDAVAHSVLVGLFYLLQGFFPVDAEVGLKVYVDAL